MGFLKAGYVALSVVTPEFAVENRKTNSNEEKIERPIGRSLSFLEGKSTFQKLMKRYMDNVALREEAQMRLLARIKENHQKSLKSPLMDRKYTSRRLVYQTKLDRFNRAIGRALSGSNQRRRRAKRGIFEVYDIRRKNAKTFQLCSLSERRFVSKLNFTETVPRKIHKHDERCKS